MKKTVNGGALKDGEQFGFKLYAEGGDEPTVIGSATVDASNATASLGTITFDKVGTYTYTLSEDPNPTEGWINADDIALTFEVSYSEDGHSLVAKQVEQDPEYGGYSRVSRDDDGAYVVSFNNSFYSEASAKISVHKEVTGGTTATADKEFSFELKDGTGAVLDTVTAKAGETATFGFEPSFTRMDQGEHVYTIHEVGENGDGWTLAPDATATVKVGMGDDTRHVEVKSVTYSNATAAGDAALFTNAYAAAGELKVEVAKTVNGGTMTPDKEFTFGLFETDAAGKKIGEAISTVTVKAGQTAIFDGVFYDQDNAGETYTYVISELGELGDGWTKAADQAVTVKVTDNGDGTMTADVAYEGGKTSAAFDNKYEEPKTPETPKTTTDKTTTTGKTATAATSSVKTGDSLAGALAAIAGLAAVSGAVALRARRMRKNDR